MNISQRIIWELDRQGKKQKDLSVFTGISTSAISAWNKNNSQPASDKLALIADFLDVSLDYLITGQEKGTEPNLYNYRWDFPENTEIDKKYNKVCYALHMLHGSMKANALLSAIELPDQPTNISHAAIKWLSDKSKTLYLFFDDAENFIETGKTSPADIEAWAFTKGFHGIEDPKALREEYPEMEKWDKNYAYLLPLAVEQYIKFDYFAEIFDEFSRFPNEHADLMAYIRQGIDNFEEARQKRLDRRKASMNAQKEETA